MHAHRAEKAPVRVKNEKQGLELQHRIWLFRTRDSLIVAAFALSPVKDGLQPFVECCGGRLCTGITSDASRLERAFIFLESF